MNNSAATAKEPITPGAEVFLQALSAAMHAVWIFDGTTMWVSHDIADGWKNKPMRYSFESWQLLFSVKQRDLLSAAIANANHEGSSLSIKLQLESTNFWIRMRGALTGNGTHSGTFCDTTDEMRQGLFYKNILDRVPAFLWIKDSDHKFTYVNQPLAGAFGKTKEEMIGLTDGDIIPDIEQVKRFRADDERVLSTHSDLAVSAEVLTDGNGLSRVLATTKIYLPPSFTTGGADGSGVLGLAIDTTQLIETRIDLITMMDSVPGASIFVKDQEGRYLHVNQVFAEAQGGRTPEEIIGKTDADFFPDSLIAIREEDRQLLNGAPAPPPSIKSDETPDGTKYRLVTKVPIPAFNDNPPKICGISMDVTDLVEARQMLRDKTELQSTILDNLPQCIFIKDEQGRYVTTNMAFAKRKGRVSPEEIKGMTDVDLSGKEAAARYQAVDREVLRSDAPKRFRELQMLGDKKHTLETTKIPLHGPDGRPDRVLGIYDDITDRLNYDRFGFESEVAGSIGHCLKNWTVLLAATEDLLAVTFPELVEDAAFRRLRRATAYLHQAAVVATQIVLLDSKPNLDFKRCDVSLLVKEVVQVMDDEECTCTVPNGPCFANIPETHLRNALVELIMNGIFHSSNKGVVGSVKIVVSTVENGHLIDVFDNGPGIPEAIREAIFNDFFAGPPDRTGMGLGYVRRVINHCGGTIRLESSPREGSHFRIMLPAGGVHC